MLDRADLDMIIMEKDACIEPSCTVIHPERLTLRRGAYVGAEAAH